MIPTQSHGKTKSGGKAAGDKSTSWDSGSMKHSKGQSKESKATQMQGRPVRMPGGRKTYAKGY